MPACLLSYPFLSWSLSVCSLGRASGEYLGDHWEDDELKLLEWDEQQQLWDSAIPRSAAVPAPALPLLPSVKTSPAASRKKCSVWASEDLQWAHEQGGWGLGPHRLTGSVLPSQNCLLLPKLALERPFPGTTKTAMPEKGNLCCLCLLLNLISFLSASLALFYRILSLGLQLYTQCTVTQIPSLGCSFIY